MYNVHCVIIIIPDPGHLLPGSPPPVAAGCHQRCQHHHRAQAEPAHHWGGTRPHTAGQFILLKYLIIFYTFKISIFPARRCWEGGREGYLDMGERKRRGKDWVYFFNFWFLVRSSVLLEKVVPFLSTFQNSTKIVSIYSIVQLQVAAMCCHVQCSMFALLTSLKYSQLVFVVVQS